MRRNCRNPDGGINKSGVVPHGVSTYETARPDHPRPLRRMVPAEEIPAALFQRTGMTCRARVSFRRHQQELAVNQFEFPERFRVIDPLAQFAN
jgi:hypothetical protein